VAPSDAPVVIEGEPGTGKELVAQLVHARSARAERPLVAVDCASLAPGVLEAELFGHARTGPHGGTTTIGRVELAHTGTLFLDRVEDAPPGTQQRLLQLLESAALTRLGEQVARPVDVRIVAATSRPLATAVQDGRFSGDLRRRLQVVCIHVPPLRRRRGDIPLLVEHFLARYGPPGAHLSAAASAALQGYEWPGNVRQLENAVRHALAGGARNTDGSLGPELFPRELTARTPHGYRERPLAATQDRRALLLRALSSHGGNRTAAARALGIGRATFYRWWRDAGLGGAPLA
jgi:DNA-binding NtrC family response regulator